MKSCSNITKRSASVHALEQRTYTLNLQYITGGNSNRPVCVKPDGKIYEFFSVNFRISIWIFGTDTLITNFSLGTEKMHRKFRHP